VYHIINHRACQAPPGKRPRAGWRGCAPPKKLDGFWEFGLSPWDIAGGALMITEAGGLVGDLQGEFGYPGIDGDTH
jgi:hypothetical protein